MLQPDAAKTRAKKLLEVL